MKILLARHGETPWNAEGRYQGQEDIPLSPVGEAQAARSANACATCASIAPSPRRCRARGAPRSSRSGEERAAMLATDAGLMEIAHGTWEGLLASEIRERDAATACKPGATRRTKC